jgi:putative transposase
VVDAIRSACTTTGPDGRVRSTPESLYGRRKLIAHLRRGGLPDVARCTVDRAMRTLGMGGIRRGKGIRTTIPGKGDTRAADLLGRDFTAPGAQPQMGRRFHPHGRAVIPRGAAVATGRDP